MDEYGGSDNNVIYNIGGTDYKCLEEQHVSKQQAQQTDLTICVFPNPDADPTLGGFHLGTTESAEGIDISTITATSSGELSVPNVNQSVEAVQVTTSGSFDVSNLDTTSLDASQVADITSYFEYAIAQELDLPVSSIVTVTSIDDGVVMYEIITYGDTSAEANAAIYPTLSDASTMTSISNTVLMLSQASSDLDISTAMALTTVDSHTLGTSSEVNTSKVTMTAELTVSNFDPSSFNTAQMEEAMTYFEDAIAQELVSQGLLSESSFVVVTGIADDGTVQYEILLYGGTNAEASSTISSISQALSNTATLASISSSVQMESSSSSTGISSSMSSVTITGNTQLSVSGLTMTAAEEEEAKGYFQDAITSSLGSLLPVGAVVTVTSIKDGVIAYEISMDVGSSSDASTTTAAIFDAIHTFLSETSTLQAITSSVVASTSFASVTISGSLSVPNVNQSVEAVQVNTSGSFDVSNLDTTSLDASQVAEIASYFEYAIAQELDLPVSSIVTVTSIDDGVVMYEIITYGDTSAEANAAIYPTLSDASTMTSISNTVLMLSQASSDLDISTAMALTTVDSHTLGTSSEVNTSKVTMTAELTVSNFDPSSFNTAQMEEAMTYFEDAIAQELVSQGLLSESSFVVVTGIADDGTVQYEILLYGGTNAEASSTISSISQALSNTATLASISSSVQMESSSSSTGISSSMSSVTITGNTQLSVSGLTMTAAEEEEAKGYFQDAITSSLGSLLPVGAVVTVTSIKDGVIAYEISMDVGSSSDASTTTAAIEDSLAETSTLQAITSSVATELLGSLNQALANSLSGATVASSTVVSSTVFPASNNSLSGAIATSNLQGATNFSESSVSEVTFNAITMEILSDGTSLITHDLSDSSLIDSVPDSSGTSMTFTINQPITLFPPLDEDIGLADEIEICSSVPLVPNQLERPELVIPSPSLARPGTQRSIQPGREKDSKSRELQQDGTDFCLSFTLGDLPGVSVSPTSVVPSGLQV